jgi:methylase of polypeptide subunit release factors
MTGKTVLELGCGCGLAGLSFMVKGAKVTLTDLSHIVSQLTATNAEVLSSRCCSDN